MSLLSRLTRAPLPNAALGLSENGACVVQVARRGNGAYTMPRVGEVGFASNVLRASFDEPNITNRREIMLALRELAAKAGLAAQRRWSVALPEAATRSAVVTLETEPAAKPELDEMLQWKAERAFGAVANELRLSHERLAIANDNQNLPRFLVCGVRATTLAEYESMFADLGWHAGLILPANFGEATWLVKANLNRSKLDSLLISAHRQGFTANILRSGAPLLIRNILCEPEDCLDEFYRLLLFYRDRLGGATETSSEGEGSKTISPLERLLVTGEGLSETSLRGIVSETLNVALPALHPQDVNLTLPDSNLRFQMLAAPAGLAALSFAD